MARHADRDKCRRRGDPSTCLALSDDHPSSVDTGRHRDRLVAAICHWLAPPVPGLGIAMPSIAPPVAAAAVAFLLSRADAGPLAYIGGSLGAVVGAGLLHQ